MVDFTGMSLWLNLAIFAAAAVCIWFAGARIVRHAEQISEKTGLGQAAVGILLLAGVTSLPEIGVIVPASLGGNATLAVNNLFGSIAMHIIVLAAVDFAIGRRALTASVPESSVLLLGALNVLVVSVAVAAMVVGDVPVFGVGLWSWACLALYVGSIWVLSRERGRRPWIAARGGEVDDALIERHERKSESADAAVASLSLPGLIGRTAAVAAVILVAGYLLSETGEAIAQQTGLGTSFVGFVLIAVSTSLPELSTALAAARRGLITLAISDVFGTNLINVALVFVVDAVASGEPVFNAAGTFTVFGALLGVVLTALFMAGLAERRDTTVFRVGIDSLAVAAVYLGGLVLLFTLR